MPYPVSGDQINAGNTSPREGFPASAFVIFTSGDIGVSFTALLGPEPPKLTGGFGGWSEVQRPGRRAFLQWTGPSVFREQIQLMFDGWSDGTSVQGDVNTLLKMAAPRSGGKPPSLSLYGPALPRAGGGWIIEDLEFLDSMRLDDGTLVRQLITVSLAQTDEGDLIRLRRQTNTGKPGQTTYRIAKGDTLQKIASKKLGKESRWKEIASLNGIRDPRSYLSKHIGDIIRIPAK